jgi:histidyl-tRNA synthetase
VGISIGLTRLFFVLEDQGLLNDDLLTSPADVLVLPMTEDLSPAIAAATALRQAGVRTQIHAEQKKFKQKLSYADKLGIPYVLLLGEDEIAQGKVALKDLSTGQQSLLTIQEAAEQVTRGLAEKTAGAPIREPEHS